jgi:hypothetical protein
MVSRGRGNFQLAAMLPRSGGTKCVPAAPARSTSGAAAGMDGEFRVLVTILLLFSGIIRRVLAAVDFVNLRRVP